MLQGYVRPKFRPPTCHDSIPPGYKISHNPSMHFPIPISQKSQLGRLNHNSVNKDIGRSRIPDILLRFLLNRR